MVFPVVMYRCESWTIKKAEHPEIDAFEQWCWWRLLRVPWKARSSQSVLKEINPECSLEGLKLQYFGHLMGTAGSLEKTLMLGKTEGRKITGWQDEMVKLHHPFNAHEMGKLQEMVRNRAAWCAAVHGFTKGRTRLGDWTTTICF